MGPPNVRAAIDEWRNADESARAAEHLLRLAWHQYAGKAEAPIAPELIASVAERRSRANARLSVALALLGVTPKSIRTHHPGDDRAEAGKPV
jgi:hypothetical protein